MTQSNTTIYEVVVHVQEDKNNIEKWRRSCYILTSDVDMTERRRELTAAPCLKPAVGTRKRQAGGNAVKFDMYTMKIAAIVLFCGKELFLTIPSETMYGFADMAIGFLTDIEIYISTLTEFRMWIVTCVSLSFEKHWSEPL